MALELLCTEQIEVAPMPIARAPVLLEPETLELEVDPYEALDLRVRAEARAIDRRNPRYVEEVQQQGMTIKWRSRMCRWMFATAKAFEMMQDTAGCGIHFMDHYLSKHSVDHVLIQLVAMMSLCIASKMHEHRPMSMREMDLLCEHKFTHKQMVAMEAALLKELEWNLNPAVSFTFARDLRSLASFDPHEHELLEDQAMQLLQTASIEYDSISFPASLLGLVALEVVVDALIPHCKCKVRDVQRFLHERVFAQHPRCIEFLTDLYLAWFDPRRLASPTSITQVDHVATEVKQASSQDPEDACAHQSTHKRQRVH